MRSLPFLLFGSVLLAPLAAQQRVSYGRDIRPILADHCFQCHGPDAAAREAELRLDLRADAIAERDAYHVIAPGDAGASELLRRIQDDEDPMPPAEHARLGRREVELLRRWIVEGAAYDVHWAYVAPRRVTPPPMAARDWVRNEVDHFVLGRLDAAARQPAPAADPRTLVRRLSFDLLGLPPTWEQVSAFAADPSDARWRGLVEEMLSSDRHAERMATFWFDLVRFADTIGIHADNPWHVSPYRDWVIEAFRSNMPFDQFTIEQVAGDLLPNASLQQQVAAAYNRLNLITREGGSQPKEFLIRYTADRVRNLSEVWLATSMGCCECHDHKFDPLPTRDFYRMGAFFADIEQVGVYGSPDRFAPELPVPTDGQAATLERLARELEGVSAELVAETPALAADRLAFAASLRDQGWRVLVPRTAKSAAGTEVTILDGGDAFAHGDAGGKDTYELSFPLPSQPTQAIRLELLADDRLPNKGPGRAGNGNLVLSEIEFFVDGEVIPIAASRATYEQPGYPVAAAHDGKSNRKGWAIMRGPQGVPAEAVFDLKDALPITSAAGKPGTLVVKMHQNHGGHLVGRWRLSCASDVGLVPLTDEDREFLAGEESQGAAPIAAKLSSLHRVHTPLLAAARGRRDELMRQQDEVRRAIPMVLQTRSVEPTETRVRPRGDWTDDSGAVVQPGVPQAFGLPMSVEGRPTRLDLAQWLVDDENPLTARVLVNRLWRLLLGDGVVSTLDDFGVQGAQPVDADLLDYLAQELIASGWDVRHLLRKIVSSATYRQASWGEGVRGPARDGAAFGRQASYRLDAEFVRDNALSISGLLNNETGGASVKPYQPSGYYAHLNFPKRTYRPSKGPALYRRSVYVHWQRQFVHPSMLAFDAPSRERCTAQRARSNTPQAALAALNDPIYIEAARVLAGQVIQSVTGDDGRLRYLWRRALQRDPEPGEVRDLVAVLQRHRSHYREHLKDAEALLTIGDWPLDEGLDLAEHAAWTSCARVVLNLHETMVRN
jgi:hypothetical protein